MSEWKILPISSVIKVIGGGTPTRSKKEYWGGNIPWLSVADFNSDDRWVDHSEQRITELGLEKSSTKLLEAGDIILSARGTVGEVSQLRVPMAFNQSCYGIRGISGKAETSFIYYALKNSINSLKQVAHGGVFDTITSNTFDLIEITLPSLSYQSKISTFLGFLDDKIALNRKLNATLEAMAQALFQSWFVDFDPVKAKLAAVRCGRHPEQAAMAAIACKLVVPPGKPKAETLDAQLPSAEAIDAAIAALADLSEAQRQSLKEKAAHFPADFQESELGLIPQGWEVKSVFDLSKPRRGKTITKAKTTKGDIPVVAGGITPAYYHNAFNTPAPAVTISASGANAGFVNLYMDNIWASDCSFINAGTTDLVFFSYTMLKVRQNEIFDMQQGAAQPHVYPKDFKRMKLSFSPKLAQFLELEFKDFYLLNKNLAHESRTLAELRDALLPKLLSGEISVGPN